MSRSELLAKSKELLIDWLSNHRFELVEQDGKRWTIKDTAGNLFYMVVTAHVDGSRANYRLCTSKWVPIQ